MPRRTSARARARQLPVGAQRRAGSRRSQHSTRGGGRMSAEPPTASLRGLVRRRREPTEGSASGMLARLILRRFRKDIRKRRGKLAAGTGFAVVYALGRVADPWPLKVVIDQILFNQPATGWWYAPFKIFGTSQYDVLAA